MARIATRLKATAAQVSVARNWPDALLQEGRLDVILVEERILERQASLMLSALRRSMCLPLILSPTFEYLDPDADRGSARGDEALEHIEAIIIRVQGIFIAGHGR